MPSLSEQLTALQALYDAKRYDDALSGYLQLAERFPDAPECPLGIAACHVALDCPNEAARYMARVLELEPDNLQAQLFQCQQLEQSGRVDAAWQALETLLARAPNFIPALLRRINLLGAREEFQAAADSCERVLALDPVNLQALFYRGVALQAMGQVEAALADYRQILAIDSEDPVAHWNAAYCELMLGHLSVGLKEYEWRWRVAALKKVARGFTEPLWLGQLPIEGQRILLHTEQGFGDTFQFLRYVELVRARGAEVLLELPASIMPLVAPHASAITLIEKGQPLPAFDVHCPLPSLPLALGTNETNVPAKTPYLWSTQERIDKWTEILGPKPAPRIGVVWSGNSGHANDRNRSIPAHQFLAGFPRNVQLVCLQREVRGADQATIDASRQVAFVGNAIADFADTAALIELCDLVICIDSAVAHLAAAMNKTTWILLDAQCDWRWQLEREDSPWYPSVRLFRRPRELDWELLLDRVMREYRRLYQPRRGLLRFFGGGR